MAVDFTTCQPNKEWLDHLAETPGAIREATDLWFNIAHRAVSTLNAREFNRRQRKDRRAELEPLHVEIPAYFTDLTDLLIVWCDVSAATIDAEALSILRDMVFAYDSGTNVSPSLEEVQEGFLRCWRLLKRITVAASLQATVEDEEDNDGDEGDGDKHAEKEGPYGLKVDVEMRTIRREGYEKSVSLASRDPLWHVFRVLFAAGKEPATLEQLKNGYPGDWGNNARNQVYHELRKALKPLDITVQRLTLLDISKSL